MPDMEQAAMPKPHNHTVFNGEADSFYDSNYELHNKMRIPKTLLVKMECEEDGASNPKAAAWNQATPNDQFDMHMPDRILVVGHDQHVGLKAPPIEMTLENSSTASEPPFTRVQTPPRVLTLGDHFFPTVDDDIGDEYANTSAMNSTLPMSNKTFINETQIVQRRISEETPAWNNSVLDVSLAPIEEIQHLRRQVGKLNRRVMAVELEMLQRQQRDKIFYAITIAYFFLKTFNWLTRN